MFSSLLVAATYLGRLAGFLVDGIPPMLVLELTAMYLPAMVVKTFSMSMLLSSLLAFGRLSSDSEIVALRAGGASLARIILPVTVYSLLVSGVTFGFDEAIVPLAARRAVAIENQIAHTKVKGAGPAYSKQIFRDEKLSMAFTAAHVDIATSEFRNVSVTVYGPDEQPKEIMTAQLVKWGGPSKPTQFLIPQGAHITSLVDPREDVDIRGEVWPGEVPPMNITFGDMIAVRNDDFDAMSLIELKQSIERHARAGDVDAHDMANFQYGYWNKMAVPLAAMVFGSLGAVLGIRNHRTGTAAGFALAVAIIFGYFMLASFMSVWALGGEIPAWIASFSPLAIGLIATIVIMRRRNG